MASDKPELITKSDLEEVMRPHLDSNTSVESFETTPLTKPGDNYGSNILSLDVILSPSHEKLALVAKLVPLAEILREMFQCDVTVRKENDMYVLVRPEYEKIQKEKKVPADKFLDAFPACYGARATRGEDVGQPVGDGALLLLENLKAKGYVTGDHAIANLARFHATAIAIRNHKPQVFKDTILKACRPSSVGPPDEDEPKKEILEYIKSIPDCKQHADKVEVVFEKTCFLSASSVIGSEAFKSIAHRDLWTSNMMFQYEKDDVKRESPIGFKIVDFQVVAFCSPIQDLIFFLFTSIEMGLVVDHYDDLIRVYYDSLIEFLQLLDCNIGPFSFETFLEEIELVAPKEFTHIVEMLQPICIDKESLPSEFSEFENVDFTSDQLKKVVAMASDKPELITKSDLEEVMRPHLESNTSVESFETTPLTKPGDNYGSNILSLDVILSPSHEKLPLVAKLVPLAEILREMFQCDITVRKENDMYVLVRPEYEKIQKENKVPADKFFDAFPACYGARATRGEDVGQPVGDGALLLLENLKAKGYVTGDRQKGLDMRHSKLAIANLARFHATAIAIRNHKPQVFKDTILRACRPSSVGLPDEDELKKEILEYIKSIPDCKQHAGKVEVVFEKTSFLSANSVIGSEAFKSIAHRDLWTSNMMFRYSEDDVKRESPIGFKIVDFQVVVYCSPIQDLIFFLYTSTEMGLVVDHYDDLIRVYYDSLIEFLQLLGCDIGPFSFETFLEEIELVAPKEFTQIVQMLQPICIDKESLPSEFSEFENVDFTSDHFKKGLGEVFLRRLSQTVNEFSKRVPRPAPNNFVVNMTSLTSASGMFEFGRVITGMSAIRPER
uniref:CHK kinase-like domain-containing protein n=1 Tax=Timema douglasi TaxID=61478 RepID=A0A7R8VRY8_TIMDO|nr:unnamed protein product [Timema douglasi]